MFTLGFHIVYCSVTYYAVLTLLVQLLILLEFLIAFFSYTTCLSCVLIFSAHSDILLKFFQKLPSSEPLHLATLVYSCSIGLLHSDLLGISFFFALFLISGTQIFCFLCLLLFAAVHAQQNSQEIICAMSWSWCFECMKTNTYKCDLCSHLNNNLIRKYSLKITSPRILKALFLFLDPPRTADVKFNARLILILW